MIGRRSPLSGLHHRNQLQSQSNQLTQQSSLNQPIKSFNTPYKPIRRPTRLIYRFPNWFIKWIIPSSFILMTLFYLSVISFKDWPPIGNKLLNEDLIDQFEGEWWVSPNITRSKRFLLVVAHPDDECLFFSPTLLNLLLPRYVNTTELEPGFLNSTSNSTRSSSSPGQKPTRHPINETLLTNPIGHILSLSSGNADGLGLKRTREMRASCWAFGIISDHCIVIDHSELPDSMSVWWPEEKITEFVKLYVDLWKIDLVITFDHHGVSGHANHRAIAAAISRIVHTDPTFPMTMMLESSSLISKYSSLFSLPLSLYQHHQTRKSLLPTFQRPPLHPSRDSERLSKLVSKTLLHFNYSIQSIEPLKFEKNLSIQSVNSNQTQIHSNQFRITNHNLSNHHTIFLSTIQQYYEGRRSFNQHISQNVWFRRLWCLFSKYMWINELKRVVPIEDRFEPDLQPLSTPFSSSDSSN